MKTIIIFQVLFIMLSSCYKEKEHDNTNPPTSDLKISLLQTFIDDSTITNINGTWKVFSYEDYINDSVTLGSDVPHWLIPCNQEVVITFLDDSISGHNTSNEVFGNYVLQKRNIKVIGYGGTKVGQPIWGNMFEDVIYKIDSFAINNLKLRFYYNNSKNSLTLEKSNPLIFI